MFVKRLLYCPGNGQELLFALVVTLVSHASSVFLVLNLSKNRGQKLDPQQEMYPQRNLLECVSRWLNQPSHASLLLLFLTSKE